MDNEKEVEESILMYVPEFAKRYIADVGTGEIYDQKRKMWLEIEPEKRTGYVGTTFENDQGEHKPMKIHTMIFSAHMGVTPDWWISKGLEIDHIDGDKSNNSLSNLQLQTRKGQYDDRTRKRMGSSGRLKEDQVRYILAEWKKWKEEGRKKSTFCNIMSEYYKKTYSCIELIVNRKTWKGLE